MKPTANRNKGKDAGGKDATTAATMAADVEKIAKTAADKRAAFLRIGERRVQSALKQIRLLRNLSNTSQYSYTEDDVAGMLAALGAALVALEGAFEGKTTTEKAFSF